MDEHNKNRSIILAITEGGLTHAEAATRFGVSTRWIRTLLARFRTGGLDAVAPRPRTPHTNPRAIPESTVNAILTLRHTLTDQGLDAGPESIWDRLPPETRPSVSTIWRTLKRHNLITPQPQKRPRSSWHRFAADAPNECWQSDFPPQAGGTPTHWPLTNGTDVEIVSWLDDHSRKLLHTSAYPAITGPIVIDTFTTTMDEHGPPASTLTDNGMVFPPQAGGTPTTRFARGHDGKRAQPNAFEQLLSDLKISQKNGARNHPTTQGKIERFHQTLKRWLAADGLVDTVEELNAQLQRFMLIYNTQRPHRAIGRRTPDEAYYATPKAEPVAELDSQVWRIRYDRVDRDGKVSLRYAGRLRHLGIGRRWAGVRVIVLIHADQTMVIAPGSGELIAEHIIDPSKNYQAKQKPER